MIQQMITLFPKEIPKMDKGEIESELRVQKWLIRFFTKQKDKLEKESLKKRYSWIRENKIEFCEIYLKNLKAMCEELEFYHERRTYEGMTRYVNTHAAKSTKEKYQEEIRKRKQNLTDDYVLKKRTKDDMRKDGISLSWDKEKFMLVAKDRGYLTEEGVIYIVGKELGLKRPAAKLIIEKGKFTWGQVLCIGALFEMTPKEFCDIFMAGYFVEKFGEYRASYDNIDKTALLKKTRVLRDSKFEYADTDDASDQT